MKNFKLYQDLDVDSEASQEEIKKAYRDKAKKNHPDHGGTIDEFLEIQIAYKVLSDSESRKTYDDTGDIEESPKTKKDQERSAAMSKVIEAFTTVVGSSDHEEIKKKDVMPIITGVLIKEITTRAKSIEKIYKDIGKMEGVMNRLTFSGAGDDYIKESLRQKRDAALTEAKRRLEANIICTLAVDMARDYSWDFQEEAFIRVDPNDLSPPGRWPDLIREW